MKAKDQITWSQYVLFEHRELSYEICLALFIFIIKDFKNSKCKHWVMLISDKVKY